MSSPSSRRVLTPIAALALAAVGCGDIAPLSAPSGPATELSILAKSSSRPTGTGIGVIGSKGDRTHQSVTYHGGAVMLAPKNLYFIWYGLWGSSTTPPILVDLAQNLGGSNYLSAITRYRSPAGTAPAGAVSYVGSIDDVYSLGASPTRSDFGLIVAQAVATQQLPADPDGIYVVFPTPDVAAPSDVGKEEFCGFHTVSGSGGVTLKVVVVSHPDRAPTKCKPQTVGPNGTSAADAMANVFVNELVNSILDPEFTGWYDKSLLEPADKCAWDFGTTYTTANGARANVALGGRDYLLQQLWVPGNRGYCTLDANARP
jgi:hypothetical protein